MVQELGGGVGKGWGGQGASCILGSSNTVLGHGAKVGLAGDRGRGEQAGWGGCMGMNVGLKAASHTFPIPAWACPSLTTTGKWGAVSCKRQEEITH